MKLINRKYIFLFIWISLITYASVTSSKKIPEFTLFQHVDKVVHFIMYLGLTVLIIPVINTLHNYKKSYIQAFIISSFTGIFFELVQKYFTIDRFSSWYDVLANILGAFLGLIFYKKIFEKTKLGKWIFKNE